MATVCVDGVLVVGGGYAGMHAAAAASDAGAPVTILDRNDRHGFITRLAAVAGGTNRADAASVPLQVFTGGMDGVSHLVGNAEAIEEGGVTTDDGRWIAAPIVIATVGSRPTRPPLPGIENLRQLRSAEQAIELRAEIGDAGSLTVLGGGPTGVQLAGSAAAANRRLAIDVVEMQDRLLPGMHPDLGAHAAAILRDRGVRVSLSTELVSADADGVDLDDGRRIDGLAVWAGGFDAVDELVDSTTTEGRLDVDPYLRVVGRERTFAAGDVAYHRRPDGTALPMSAQIATAAGAAAGRNAARLLAGELPEPVELRQRGWVLDLGGRQGVAEFGPVRLARPGLDRLAPALHLAIDAKNLWQIAGVTGLRHLPVPWGARS